MINALAALAGTYFCCGFAIFATSIRSLLGYYGALRMKQLLLLSLLIPINSLASSYKELGESGGTKKSALEKLGAPTVEAELSVPDFIVKGLGPVSCELANELIDKFYYFELS